MPLPCEHCKHGYFGYWWELWEFRRWVLWNGKKRGILYLSLHPLLPTYTGTPIHRNNTHYLCVIYLYSYRILLIYLCKKIVLEEKRNQKKVEFESELRENGESGPDRVTDAHRLPRNFGLRPETARVFDCIQFGVRKLGVRIMMDVHFPPEWLLRQHFRNPRLPPSPHS